MLYAYTTCAYNINFVYCDMKTCPKCETPKELSEFYKRKNGTYDSWCRKCIMKKNSSLNHKYRNTSKAKENKKWYQFKKKYGLSKEEYELMLHKQQGKCLCCNIVPTKICVDHDHKTGAVRGLLCVKCNMAIGLAGDNWMVLQKLADYIRIRQN